MRKKIPPFISKFIVMLFITGVLPRLSYGLVPLESLLLGDFSDRYEVEITDPLYYIFRDIKREKSALNRQSIDQEKLLKFVLYRGMIDEGHNLNNKCKKRPSLDFATRNELSNAKRVFLSTLQFLTLDLSTEYMARYAQYFDFSNEEYRNLVNNLIGNYCSQNLTTISLKQLKQNMLARFSKGRGIDLPTLENDPFFPKSLGRVNSGPQARKQEFAWTLELFKSSCSWANEVDNARLLVPLARNPIIAASVIRELSGIGLSWERKLEKIVKIPVESSLQISCRNMICRRNDKVTFLRQIPQTVGSSSIEDDFERLYCNEFRDLDYKVKNQEPKIENHIKQLTFDDQYLLTGQLVALMTGYPDFMVQADKFSDLMTFMRSPMDKSWDSWAEAQNGNYKQAMTYEESLTLDLVEPELYFKKDLSKFQVELDINQGEFDRAINIMGKLRVKIDLKLSKKFLSWVRSSWKKIDEKVEPKKAERVRIPFRARLNHKLDELREKFPIVPWSESLTELVVRELTRQVASYEGDFFNESNSGFIEAPIYINFSPYALRHMRYRYLIKKNESGEESDLSKLRNLSLSF